MHKSKENIYNKIIQVSGKDRVRIDPFERRMYSHDLASLPKMMELGFKMMPDFVVKPKSSEEISEIVKIAAQEGIPIVPRGGASWGLGGAMPVEGGIVFDLTRMNRILKIDEDNLTVTVETGITWKMLYENLIRKGFLIGSYPSSAYAATVGGWINTGGVGVGSYKYGSALDQIRGLEVVLPTGRILNLGNDNTINYGGYDLNRLFFGSEGTIGIITSASLKIYPAPQELRPLSYGFLDFKTLSNAVRSITKSDIVPLHISFLDKNHFDFLGEIGMAERPLKMRGILNMALEGNTEILDIQEKTLDDIAAECHGKKQSEEFADHEWNERFYELRTKRAGPSAVLGEVFVPISNMSSMVNATYKLIKKMKLRAAITGMVGDRNTVIFMPYYLSDERKMIRNMVSLSFVKKLGDLAFEHEGRPAGLGLFFSGNIKKMYGDGTGVMREIKTTMDPYDVMNPGKTTEGLTRFGIPIPSFAMNMGMNIMAWVKHIMPKDKRVVS
ncbi:MAG: FAD-binding oxidoreductase [Thermoplasmata archaeon]|nr:MAG: FAD-binding oxidoreductase [Thermoplasmata archaeon]